jgi:1-acyl-sn-glycerol-3-phosphate acyltransferase
MTRFYQWLVVLVVKFVTTVLCRVEKDDIANVPANGPLIVAVNHIGSLEVPLLLAYLAPRKMSALAKIETWDNKFKGWLFGLWDSIPIRRGEVDLLAVRGCIAALSAGNILWVAPEGTRSRDGVLLRGQPGIALIALHTGAPILPIAHWGAENFPQNIKGLKRTDIHIRVGKPFTLDAKGDKVHSNVRQEMADEIMYQIASLMPEEYRGFYANCTNLPQKYLRFA